MTAPKHDPREPSCPSGGYSREREFVDPGHSSPTPAFPILPPTARCAQSRSPATTVIDVTRHRRVCLGLEERIFTAREMIVEMGRDARETSTVRSLSLSTCDRVRLNRTYVARRERNSQFAHRRRSERRHFAVSVYCIIGRIRPRRNVDSFIAAALAIIVSRATPNRVCHGRIRFERAKCTINAEQRHQWEMPHVRLNATTGEGAAHARITFRGCDVSRECVSLSRSPGSNRDIATAIKLTIMDKLDIFVHVFCANVELRETYHYAN